MRPGRGTAVVVAAAAVKRPLPRGLRKAGSCFKEASQWVAGLASGPIAAGGVPHLLAPLPLAPAAHRTWTAAESRRRALWRPAAPAGPHRRGAATWLRPLALAPVGGLRGHNRGGTADCRPPAGGTARARAIPRMRPLKTPRALRCPPPDRCPGICMSRQAPRAGIEPASRAGGCQLPPLPSPPPSPLLPAARGCVTQTEAQPHNRSAPLSMSLPSSMPKRWTGLRQRGSTERSGADVTVRWRRRAESAWQLQAQHNPPLHPCPCTHKPTTLKKQPSMPRTKLPASPWMPAQGGRACEGRHPAASAGAGPGEQAEQGCASRSSCASCHLAPRTLRQPRHAAHRSCRPCQTAPQRPRTPRWLRGSARQTGRWWSPQSCGASGRCLQAGAGGRAAGEGFAPAAAAGW